MADCIANLPGTSMELISMATASVLAIGQVRRGSTSEEPAPYVEAEW